MFRLAGMVLLDSLSIFILYRIILTVDSTEYSVRLVSSYISIALHAFAMLLAVLTGPRAGMDWSVSRNRCRSNLLWLIFFPLYSGVAWYTGSEQNMDGLATTGVINGFLSLFLLHWYWADFRLASHQVWHRENYGDFLAPSLAGQCGVRVEAFVPGQKLHMEGPSQVRNLLGFLTWILISVSVLLIALFLPDGPFYFWMFWAIVPLVLGFYEYPEVWKGQIRLRKEILIIENEEVRIRMNDRYARLAMAAIEGFLASVEKHRVSYRDERIGQRRIFEQYWLAIYARLKPGASAPNDWPQVERDVPIGDFQIVSSNAKEDAEEAEEFLEYALGTINERSGR